MFSAQSTNVIRVKVDLVLTSSHLQRDYNGIRVKVEWVESQPIVTVSTVQSLTWAVFNSEGF